VDDGGLTGVEVKEGESDGRRLKLFSKHFPKRAVRAMLVAGERGAAGGAEGPIPRHGGDVCLGVAGSCLGVGQGGP
jgi:hypothetical protein